MEQRSSSGFGRGWVPMARDIGLPDDVWPDGAAVTPAPLQGRGLGGGGSPAGAAYAASPHPNASPEGEGLHCAPRLAAPFTPERQVRFLHHLAATGHVRRACERVGVSAQAAYVHKRRDHAFARGWDAALVLARDAAEELLAERALEGTRETIFYRGEAVGSRVRFDARLLLAHLARLDKHHAEAPAAQAVAARFDDYLGDLLAGEACFLPPGEHEEPEIAPEWHPARPTRDGAIAAARDEALYDVPDDLADLPAEMLESTLAALDTEDLADEDIWPEAVAAMQAEAERLAAAAWDAETAARHAALDALVGGGDPHGGEGGIGAPVQTKAASPSREAPCERPAETKAFKPPQDRVNRVNRCREARV